MSASNTKTKIRFIKNQLWGELDALSEVTTAYDGDIKQVKRHLNDIDDIIHRW